MFASFSQKLCFYDIQYVVNNCLCKQEFRQEILKYGKKEEIDEDMNLTYTFEFLLLKEFSFIEDSIQVQKQCDEEKEEKKRKECEVM